MKWRVVNIKTMRILFFLIALFVGKGTMFAQETTIEEIGKHLSELLISRGNIEESQYAIKIERLYPNKEDFSEFEDSPAEYILSLLYGAEQILPETWGELLLQADSLNITENAKYFKTYYQTNNDTFLLTCVLKQSSKYYAFSSIVLEWGKDQYVMRIYKKMKEYNNIKELEDNIYSIVREEELKEMESHIQE